MLQQKIGEDLNGAMKARDELRVSTLRMLKAAISNYSIEKRKDALEDGEIMDLIAKQIKQRRDSIEGFQKGGRADLAAKEESEMKILQAYLPEPLGEAELRNIAEDVLGKLGLTSKKDMGRAMKEIMPLVKGRADSRAVNEIISSLLK